MYSSNAQTTIQQNTFQQNIDQMLVNCDGHYPSLEMIASELGCSGRTLRRQLSGVGTSYQKMLNELRCKKAKQLLSSSTLCTEEIAEQLGFSDAANFRHAFKKWVGKAPGVYRNEFTDTVAA